MPPGGAVTQGTRLKMCIALDNYVYYISAKYQSSSINIGEALGMQRRSPPIVANNKNNKNNKKDRENLTKIIKMPM